MDIDHINGNGLDNRLENLRLVSRQENAKNRKITKNIKQGDFRIKIKKNNIRMEKKQGKYWFKLFSHVIVKVEPVAFDKYLKIRTEEK